MPKDSHNSLHHPNSQVELAASPTTLWSRSVSLCLTTDKDLALALADLLEKIARLSPAAEIALMSLIWADSSEREQQRLASPTAHREQFFSLAFLDRLPIHTKRAFAKNPRQIIASLMLLISKKFFSGNTWCSARTVEHTTLGSAFRKTTMAYCREGWSLFATLDEKEKTILENTLRSYYRYTQLSRTGDCYKRFQHARRKSWITKSLTSLSNFTFDKDRHDAFLGSMILLPLFFNPSLFFVLFDYDCMPTISWEIFPIGNSAIIGFILLVMLATHVKYASTFLAPNTDILSADVENEVIECLTLLKDIIEAVAKRHNMVLEDAPVDAEQVEAMESVAKTMLETS